MSILLTILGIALIVVAALLALASIVGYQRGETRRANIVVALSLVILIGGAVLVATN